MPSLNLPDDEELIRRFPSLAAPLAHPLDRRRTLKLLAAALATGTLGGCDPGTPTKKMVSAVIAPPGIVPGQPNRFATAHLLDGYASGIVVTHYMGRPTKVEGNPLHPASLGATDAFGQAAIYDFYDPDRAAAPMARGAPTDWQSIETAFETLRTHLAARHGAGAWILTGTVTSPTIGAAIDAVRARYPEARWVQWDPVSRDAVRAGAVLAYGRPVAAIPHLDRADVVLAIDSDLLESAPGHVRFGREFAARRNPARSAMSRIYAVEPTPSLIGVAGDHRFIANARDLPRILQAIADGVLHRPPPADAPDWIAPVVADLLAHRGRALVHLGPHLPAEAHALAFALNEALGARGATLGLVEPVEYAPAGQGASFADLLQGMEAGEVSALLVLDVNAAYVSPRFAAALPRVPLSFVLAPFADETAHGAAWFIPQAHDFETWGDARAFDGTASILQPQSLPLYGGRSATEVLSRCLGPTATTPLAAVRATWKAQLGDAQAWHDALADGVIPNSASRPAEVRLRPEAVRLSVQSPTASAIEVLFRPDPAVWDGRYGNNAWMQELPRPFSKIVWDNPLHVSPQMAAAHGLRNGDEVLLRMGGREARLAVWVMAGQASETAVALLGYGRTHAGETGNDVGANLYPLREVSGDVSITRTGRRVPIARTEHVDASAADPDDILRHGTLDEFNRDPHYLQQEAAGPALYRHVPPGKVAWGMSIDLNACIGCNACVVACMAENNVPVVGKDQVLRNREMHWLRIDRYYEGPSEAPLTLLQPLLCQHCEQAPCEVVCPVEATVHDEEGLNLQVYNRCIGTRFCSNNCPYKVRRFNFHDYAGLERRPAISRNPDVTARGRGVMEKCSFCVQRIAEARIAADRDGVPEQAVTACQAACPTRVFSFGNLHDEGSEVVARKHSPLNYVLLPDQNTHPRVTYEARITNPNPAIHA
jgi:Fe-S-cluster-containing dehydrogenase component/anaerobic selenocysteine-containing dehydrogenase